MLLDEMMVDSVWWGTAADRRGSAEAVKPGPPDAGEKASVHHFLVLCAMPACQRLLHLLMSVWCGVVELVERRALLSSGCPVAHAAGATAAAVVAVAAWFAAKTLAMHPRLIVRGGASGGQAAHPMRLRGYRG